MKLRIEIDDLGGGACTATLEQFQQLTGGLLTNDEIAAIAMGETIVTETDEGVTVQVEKDRKN